MVIKMSEIVEIRLDRKANAVANKVVTLRAKFVPNGSEVPVKGIHLYDEMDKITKVNNVYHIQPDNNVSVLVSLIAGLDDGRDVLAPKETFVNAWYVEDQETGNVFIMSDEEYQSRIIHSSIEQIADAEKTELADKPDGIDGTDIPDNKDHLTATDIPNEQAKNTQG